MSNATCNNGWGFEQPKCWCGNNLNEHWRDKECLRTTEKNKYGIRVGQVWNRADGTNDSVVVIGFSYFDKDDVIIKRILSGETFSIDMFKLTYRYYLQTV